MSQTDRLTFVVIVNVDTLVALVKVRTEGIVWILKVCWDTTTAGNNNVTVASVLHELNLF